MSYDQEIAFIIYLQSYAWPLPLMLLASAVGSLEFYLLMIPAIYWCFDTRLGFRLALILVICQGLNSSLKVAFHMPRPYWVSRKVMAASGYESFGLPSGHAQNSICVWGFLANFSASIWAWAAAFVLIIVIAVSRMYLGAHFPTDIAAGWAIGALILVMFLRLEPWLKELLNTLDLKQRIIVSFLSSLALLAIYIICLNSIGSWHIPLSWPKNALATSGLPISPFNPEEVLASAGTLFGMGSGYSYLLHRGGFKADGPAVIRLTRYLLGVTGLIIIWYGAGELGLHQGIFVGYGVAYLRAMLEGIWVALVAPILFIKIGLAEKKD